MVSPLEAAVQRVITENFISASPVTLSLSRPSLADDGAGGRTTVWNSLPPQIFRMVLQTGSNVIRSVDGEELRPEFALVGPWNADVNRGDRFTYDGIVYEVIWTHPGNVMPTAYEIRAEVVSRG